VEDGNLEIAERDIADARSMLLTATVFQRLAANPAWASAVAEHLVQCASRDLAEVGENDA
jgi:hypothetical protein